MGVRPPSDQLLMGSQAPTGRNRSQTRMREGIQTNYERKQILSSKI